MSSDTYQANSNGSAFSPQSSEGESQSGNSMPVVMWRFKWLLVFAGVVGFSIGYWRSLQKPTTYQASTKLMFKTDKPLSIDSVTGSIVGGVPSGALLQSLIASDDIIALASSDPGLAAIPSLSGKSPAVIGSILRGGIQFAPETSQRDAADRMIADMHFGGSDADTCVAAVNTMTRAIETYFEGERESSLNQFSKLIANAQQKLLPELAQLEEQYKEFRFGAPLEWDPNGGVVNPHRTRQFSLQGQKDQSEQEARGLMAELRLIKSIRERYEDPVLVAQLIGRDGVLGKTTLDRLATRSSNPAIADLELEQLTVERSLVPLLTEREQMIADLGSLHPAVLSLTSRITSTRKQLNELDEARVERLTELAKEGADTGDSGKYQREAALKSVESYTRSIEERLRAIDENVAEMQVAIDVEKKAANTLTQAENDDAMYRRQIERVQGMLIQLEQQVAALNLADVSGGLVVTPIRASNSAATIRPDLKQDVAMSTILGIGIGALIAMLLEMSAKMFRSSEEIALELRTPVLVHVPLDEGRAKSTKGQANTELSKLDPKLSVVHRPYSPAAEAIRGLRTSILFDKRTYESKVFQVTSPLPGDGKSTLAANLAASLAQSGKSVLLIDLDLRSPRLSERFNVSQETGLTNVLNGECSPSEAICNTPIENLDILPCGVLPSNPSEALTLPEMAEVFVWVREQYDFVIVDSPPLLLVTDPAITTSYVDAVLLVLRVRRRVKPNAIEAMAMLRNAGARVVGVVVNKVDELASGSSYRSGASGSYGSIGYGYGYKYRSKYLSDQSPEESFMVLGRGRSQYPKDDRRNAVQVELDQDDAVVNPR